jgi:hypothetical protein
MSYIPDHGRLDAELHRQRDQQLDQAAQQRADEDDASPKPSGLALLLARVRARLRGEKQR